MTPAGYRCPLYDDDASPTDTSSDVINPEVIPPGQPT